MPRERKAPTRLVEADVEEKKSRPRKTKKTVTKKAGATKVATKKSAKGAKDPNKPKRARSAFMFFSQANRARVVKENPTAAFGEIGKLIGAEWNTLPEKQRTKYNKQAEEDKTRAARENAAYKA